MAYLGRAGSEPQVSRRSSGTRCAQRDAVVAEAERARCSRLMTLSAALSPAPPRAPPRALHPQCNVQSPALPVQRPMQRPVQRPAPLCLNAPARALHSLATSSTAPCTAVHHPHALLALRSPPTRCSLALASRPPAPPSSSSCFGEAQWLLVAVATEVPMAPAFHQEPSAALY